MWIAQRGAGGNDVPMRYEFTVLASGSKGNASLLRAPGGNLLIDAGLNGKQLEARLASVGLGLDSIDAVVLTHEHGDHCAGVPALLRHGRCEFLANRGTWQALGVEAGGRWREWASGTTVEAAGLVLRSFPVPHDAAEPVGVTIEAGARQVAVVTDLGFSPQLVIERVKGCGLLVLEANYDAELLRLDPKRPWAVKQRIANRHGHLSNEAAAALLAQVATPALGDVFLAHLSEDCNRAELAEAAVRGCLEGMGLGGVRVHRTSFLEASAAVVWES